MRAPALTTDSAAPASDAGRVDVSAGKARGARSGELAAARVEHGWATVPNQCLQARVGKHAAQLGPVLVLCGQGD